MPRVERGEVWLIDFGLAATVRPALVLTEEPDDDEFDLFTVVLHTTALRGNRWELAIKSRSFRQALSTQQVQTISGAKLIRRLGTLLPKEIIQVEEALEARLKLKRRL